jgi:hypothetical protein
MSKAEFDYKQTLESGNKPAADAAKAQAKVA